MKEVENHLLNHSNASIISKPELTNSTLAVSCSLPELLSGFKSINEIPDITADLDCDSSLFFTEEGT